MRYEEILNKILEINQKFERCNKENASELYFEMLHSNLIEILSGCTEEQFNESTLFFQTTFKKLEKDILEYCSKIYMENYQEYIKEHGLFIKKQEEYIEDEIAQYYEYEEDNDEYDNDENDDNYELKWIDNPPYNSNLIL
ncbi:hypothetical protein J6Q66_09485 [bacterium]|nr:hypothetical protein [bacterium]